jgi:hypothetical protein
MAICVGSAIEYRTLAARALRVAEETAARAMLRRIGARLSVVLRVSQPGIRTVEAGAGRRHRAARSAGYAHEYRRQLQQVPAAN